MKELILKIEQWAHERNIINGSKPIDQAMKLFSEFGELADNVGKGRDCRDDVGDVFVVLTIISAQTGHSISEIDIPTWAESNNKELVLKLTKPHCWSVSKSPTTTLKIEEELCRMACLSRNPILLTPLF